MPFDYVVICEATGKVRHPSRKVAVTNLRRILHGLDAAGRDRKERGRLVAYPCRACVGGWHIGNNEPFVIRLRKARGLWRDAA